MRISTNQFFQQGVAAMIDQQAALSYTQNQMSSGIKNLLPSDDPSAVVRVRDLDESIDTITQYQRNADAAEARLSQEETALSDITNLLQRIRELNVQGNNLSKSAIAPVVTADIGNTGAITVTHADSSDPIYQNYSFSYDGTDWTLQNNDTVQSTTLTGAGPFNIAGMTITLDGGEASGDTYTINPVSVDLATQQDKQIIAIEIRQHLDGIQQLLNQRDANGEYLFAGFKTNTQPFTFSAANNTFTYSGDQGQRFIQIGASRSVAIGDPGSAFFNNLSTADTTDVDGVTDLASIIDSIADAFEAGFGRQVSLTDIDTAMGEIDRTRAKIGSRRNAIDEQRNSNDAVKIALQQNRSSLQDLDYAEAAARFNQQLLALQASQQSFVRIQGLSLFNYL